MKTELKGNLNCVLVCILIFFFFGLAWGWGEQKISHIEFNCTQSSHPLWTLIQQAVM